MIIYIFSFIVVVIDLIIKLFIKNNFILNKSIEVINNFFYITYSKNYGVAWSLLSGKQYISIIIAVLVLIYLLFDINKRKKLVFFDILGYSLLIGGIIGNLIDRVIYGYVIDYLDFYIFNYNYPIFNFADICIVIGVFIMLFVKGEK